MPINVIPGSTLKIEVFGDILPWDAGFAESELARALRAHTGPIRVLINSRGGDADTGMAFHALLSAYPDVTTHNIAVAASAAAVIFAAGKTRLVNPAAVTMLHESATGVGGKAADLEEAAAMLRAVDAGMVEIFAAATGKPRKDIEKAMADTSWLTSGEALALGLATALAEPEQAAANARPLQNTKARDSRAITTMDIRQKLGLAADATDAQVADALDSLLAQPKPAPAAPAPVVEPVAPTAQAPTLTYATLEDAIQRALSARGAVEAHAQACVSAVERFIADGKIAPASREAAIKACGNSAATLTAQVEYWTSAPKIIGSIALNKPTASASKLTPRQAEFCKAANISEADFLANN